MTKQDQLQQELKETVTPGIKPSDIKRLKRSKSLGDIPLAPPPPNHELTLLQTENKELKKQVTELQDQILELRLSKIKDFGAYRENLKETEKDLSAQISQDNQEITNLEQRVQALLKESTRLSGEKALLEWKLSKKELGENSASFDWWIDYGPIIGLVLAAWLGVWLLSKDSK